MAKAEPGGLPGRGCLGCVTIWIVLMVVYVGQLQWKFHQRDVRNAAFVADAGRVADALEAHARAHDGVFPAPAEVRAAVPAWPVQRWVHRKASPAPVPLVTPDARMTFRLGAAEHPIAGTAAGGPLPSFAPGRHAGLNYGAAPLGSLIYETDPTRRRYVLYAVGGYALSDSPDGGVELPAIRLVRTNRQ